MANMSYCRFRNTLADLQDCYQALDEETPDPEEARARVKVILLAKKIADEYAEWAQDTLIDTSKPS